MLSVLRRRDFALVWLAGLVSETGDWLLITGLPIFVFAMTGSSLITSTVFIVELVPAILLGSFTGVLVDRRDHRRVMIAASLAQALVLFPLLSVHSTHDLWVVYLVAAGEAVLTQFFEPAKNAALPTLVDPVDVVAANNLVALNSNVGRLLGSSVGGLAVMGGSLTAVATGNVASFLIAAALIAAARFTPGRPGDSRPDAVTDKPVSLRHAWQDGVRLVSRPGEVRVAFLSAAVGAVAQGLFVVLFVVFVSRVLHGDGMEVGLLRGVQAIGGILGGLLLGTLGARIPPRQLIILGATTFGVLGWATWNAPLVTLTEGLYIGLFIAIGIPGVAYTSGLFSLLQHHIPTSHLGRTFGAFLTVYTGFQALGMMLAGVLGDAVGVVPVLNVQAGLYLLAGVIAYVGLRTRRCGTAKGCGTAETGCRSW